MNLKGRIKALKELGFEIKSLLNSNEKEYLFSKVKNENGWFTNDNLSLSLSSISENFLNESAIYSFCENYNLDHSNNPKNIGIVASGNIPAVAFHDLLCVFLSGNRTKIKLSSTDNSLMSYLINELHEISPEIKDLIQISDRLNNVDALIATGSNNTARYFEYYFSKIPNIIRKNRTSVSILDGTEKKSQLADLGNDIFRYFGLGCRNVSKLLVPNDYDFQTFFESIEYWNTINLHHKFNNNYDYNKSIYLINGDKHFDNGFLLVKEDTGLVSPLGVLFYETYDGISDVKKYIELNKERIQCVVGNPNLNLKTINFGMSQAPSLSDFADDVDTLLFLQNLN